MSQDILTAISTIGFPIVACIALFFGCKFMLTQQQQNIDRMFEMYDKANIDNREAIKACTEAINKLCDKLDDIEKR
jgi:hypothetical protein